HGDGAAEGGQAHQDEDDDLGGHPTLPSVDITGLVRPDSAPGTSPPAPASPATSGCPRRRHSRWVRLLSPTHRRPGAPTCRRTGPRGTCEARTRRDASAAPPW